MLASLPIFVRDLRRDRRNPEVVGGLDAQHARAAGCAEPHREHRAQCQRHLAEHVSDRTCADDLLDALDDPDRFDPTLEDAEERTLLAHVDGVGPGGQADVGGDPGELFAVGGLQRLEDRDPADLVGRHHGPRLRREAARPDSRCSALGTATTLRVPRRAHNRHGDSGLSWGLSPGHGSNGRPQVVRADDDSRARRV